MSNFKILNYLDAALVAQEGKEPKASRIPAVWPSEASAIKIDKTEGNIIGTCHRRAFGRMVGWPVTSQVDPVSAWRFVTGRSIEDHVVTLANLTNPKIYVANGVRHFVEDIYLPFEMDLIVKAPEGNIGWIVECKTIYGYMSTKEVIGNGKPKLEHVMQIALYLLEVKNGQRLKEIIFNGWTEKQSRQLKLIAEGKEVTPDRNRIQIADPAFINQMSDGQIGGKLVYIARDSCERKEFDITIEEDFDGSTYPCVDGMMWKIFTVESIYERYKTLQNYWFVARAEAERRLAEKGLLPPSTLRLIRGRGDHPEEVPGLTEEQKQLEAQYLARLERETASLGVEFWPPAEYQWSYSADKIEFLHNKKLIGDKKYTDWKKKKNGVTKIGDWQCGFCPFRKQCVPHQNPNWAYQLYDIDSMVPVDQGEE